MDIQKERELFEAWCHVDDKFCTHRYAGSEDYSDDYAQCAWLAWQAAKAQAVPKGFVVVKTSDIAKLAIAVSRVDLMTYSEARPDSEKLAWQNVANKLEAMIEAQEQNQ